MAEVVHSVFISYARATSRPHAEALRAALEKAGTSAFLDTSEIAVGAQFPAVLGNAILDARVFVLFADIRYFESWYCLRELRLALAEFEERLKRGEPDSARNSALAHVVVALPPGGAQANELTRLPSTLATQNSGAAHETAKLVADIRSRAGGTTIRERQREAGVSEQMQGALVSGSRLLEPANLGTLRVFPSALPMSLGPGFIGRHDELWRLDHLLATRRAIPPTTAAAVVAMYGGAGTGKSRLALEYLYRLGPLRFPGGIFWVDASGTQDVEDQHYGIWQRLDPQNTATLPEIRASGKNVTAMLAQALHEQPREAPILFVLDNVPEAGPDAPALPLKTWCPAQSGEVAILATSRRRLDVGAPGIDVLEVTTLTTDAAVELLKRDLKVSAADPTVWVRIADGVGNLPLALDLLNKAIEAGAADPGELAKDIDEADEIVSVVDEQAEVLRTLVSEDRVHGITQAFNLSFGLLPEAAQAAAILFAFFAPSPIPAVFLEVMDFDGFGTPRKVVRARLLTHAVLSSYGNEVTGDVPVLGVMHRVLASFLRSKSDDPKDSWTMAVSVLALTLGTVNGEDPTARPLLRAGLPHVRYVLDHLSEGVLLGESNPSLAAQLLRQLAGALHGLGESSGERGALTESVRALRIALRECTPELPVMEAAGVRLDLGRTLVHLGLRESGAESIEEAAQLFKEVLALGEKLDADSSLAVEGELSNTLLELGRRSGSDELTANAVEQLRSIVGRINRTAAPLAWAAAQNNFAIALGTVADQTTDADRARRAREEAVAAYRFALEEYTETGAAEDWARTQANLATAIVAAEQSKREPDRTSIDALKEAVALQQKALKVLTREARPRDWAQLQVQIAETLVELDRRDPSHDYRHEAVDAYFAALEETRREDDPLQWARLCETVAAIAWSLAGDDDTDLLDVALAYVENALEVLTREVDVERWARLLDAHGQMLSQRAGGESRADQLRGAIDSFRTVLDALPPEAEQRASVEEHLEATAELLRTVKATDDYHRL